MTPTEILSANVLEILFERRNKEYGAYTLRKFYNNRLLIALTVSFSAGFCLMLLVSNLQKAGVIMPDLDLPKPTVVIRDFIDPPKPEVPKPPKAPAVARQAPTAPHTTPLIVANTPINTMATQDDLEKLNVGTKPTISDGIPGIATPLGDPVSAGGSIVAPSSEPPAPIFKPLERQPEFPGGQAAWLAFLNKYLQAPDELEAGERKSVSVRFWVSEDGSINNFEVLKSGGKAFDNEVVRVLKKMPKWKPAIQNGRPVATGFTQPVTFMAAEE